MTDWVKLTDFPQDEVPEIEIDLTKHDFLKVYALTSPDFDTYDPTFPLEYLYTDIDAQGCFLDLKTSYEAQDGQQEMFMIELITHNIEQYRPSFLLTQEALIEIHASNSQSLFKLQRALVSKEQWGTI